MTVRDLIEALSDAPLDAEVRVGYTQRSLEMGMGWQDRDVSMPAGSASYSQDENVLTVQAKEEE